MINLRDYQENAHSETINRLKDGQTCLIVTSPTGSGKSALITYLIAHQIVRSKNVLFLSHRKELVNNIFYLAKKELHLTPNKYNSKLFISNIGSFKTLERKLSLNPGNINTIIIDECHHVMSPNYERVLSLYKNHGCNIIGYTATPKRLDNKCLSHIFNDLIQTDTLSSLTEKNWLCPYKLYKSEESLEIFDNVQSDKKDYKEEDVFIKIKNHISHECVLEHYKSVENGQGKAIGFAPNIEYAESINSFFNRNGVKSVLITSKTKQKDREFLMSCFEKNMIKCLWNVELFTEGIDVPDCNVLLNLRLTKSIVLWHQIIGRILRLHPSKTIAHVFDFTKNWHDLPLPDNIIWALDKYEERDKTRIGDTKEITFKEYITVNNIILNLTYSEKILTQNHKEEIDLWLKIAQDTNHDNNWVMNKFNKMPNFEGLSDIIQEYINKKGVIKYAF